MTSMQESHDTNKNVNKRTKKKMIHCLNKERSLLQIYPSRLLNDVSMAIRISGAIQFFKNFVYFQLQRVCGRMFKRS